MLSLAGFIACVFAVVLVPYLFPPHSGISVSTMAGFSNRAAQVVLLGAGLLFGIATRGWGLRLAEQDTPTANPWRWAVPAAAVAIVSAASLYLWHWASTMGPYDEAIYFLDRFSNQLAGGHVLRDFNFDYGPLLYYPSWWLAAALRIPVGHAYYLFCGLEWVAGVLLLWHVIGQLRARAFDRVFTFGVLTLAWFTSITDQGAQYTPLRFVLASVCTLWVHGLWRKHSRPGRPQTLLPAMAAAAFSFVALLLYSPEQGIGFALATLLFFAVGVRTRDLALPLLGFAAVCAAVFAVVARLGWLGVLFTFAGGSYNLPVLAGLGTMFLIAMLVAAAAVVVGTFLHGDTSRPELYLIALALVAVPAAFGRADAGHIFINTMPALLVLTLALLQLPESRAAVIAGWMVYIGIAGASHMRQQVNVLMHSWPRLEKMPDTAQLPPPGARLRAPIRYFSYLDGQFGPTVTTGRDYSFDLVFPGLAEEKIRELQLHPRDLLVVPVDYQQACQMLPPEVRRQSMRDDVTDLFVPRLRAVPNVKQPLCDYIHTHYVGSPYRVPREEYRVLQPRAFPLSPQTGTAGAELPPESTAQTRSGAALRLP